MSETNGIGKIRQPYEKPALTQMTVEEAKAMLRDRVEQGHEAAKEALEWLSSSSGDASGQVNESKRKSA